MADDPDYIALLAARDERFRVLQEAIAVEADMRDNATIKAFIAAIRAEAEVAMADLADTSPADVKAIGLISVRVGAYSLVKRLIETIIARGRLAEAAIRQQDTDFSDERLPDGH